MEGKKSLLNNTIIIAIGTCLSTLSGLIILPILTARLTKAEYGTYDLILTLISLGLPLVTMQLPTAAFRFLVECRDDVNEIKKVVTNIVTYVFIAAMISACLIVIFLNKLPNEDRILIALYFSLSLYLYSFQQIARGLAMNKIFATSSALQSVISMIFIFALIYCCNDGLSGVMVALLISTVISEIFVCEKLKIFSLIDFSLLSIATVKNMLSYAWPMIPNSLSNWILSVSDRLVITAFIGIEANAIYSVSNKIPAFMLSIYATFITAWQENASQVIKEKDVDKYYSDIFMDVVDIISGLLALIIAATPIIFRLLIRGEYFASYVQIPILLMAAYFSAISAFIGGIYIAHKRTKNIGITTLVAAGINLSIDLIFVNKIGIYAASISTLVSYVWLAVYRMINVCRFQHLKYNLKRIIIEFFCVMVMCALCALNISTINILSCLFEIFFAIYINHDRIVKMFTALFGHEKKY